MSVKSVSRAFIINSRDDVLLVKHRDDQPWVLPGGHIESNETPVKALKRELQEEFALEIQVMGSKNSTGDSNVYMEPLPISMHTVQYTHHEKKKKVSKLEYRYFAFASHPSDLKIDSKEISSRKWMSIDDVLGLKAGVECYQTMLDVLSQNRDLLELLK